MSRGSENFNAKDLDPSSSKQSYSADNQGSPEKVASKRSRPNPPITPTKSIDIENTGSGRARNLCEISLDEKLPLWVAGASPAKFIALEDIIKMNSAIEKMAIVHEIAVDPKFNVEDFQKRDPIYSTVKTTMHKAYWEMLQADVEKDPADCMFAD